MLCSGLSLAVGHLNQNVAVALGDAYAPALRSRVKALEHRGRIDLDAGDLELVHVGVEIVVRVGDSRIEHLEHDARALLRHELQGGHGARRGLAPDRVHHQAALLRGDACVAQFRCGLHAYSAAETFLSPECALKVRVGANSPSLWPPMFSDTSPGTCSRPLCTAMVRPTMSGMTMERRDQVLIGRRSFFWLAVCTFLARCKSTNGPFLSERGTLNISSLKFVCSCGAERSCRRCAYCGASSCPWSASPTGSRDADFPDRICLRR